jgi:hypothetical protein
MEKKTTSEKQNQQLQLYLTREREKKENKQQLCMSMMKDRPSIS